MPANTNKRVVRVETLSASEAGMTRLRDRGGASPKTLYELTNGFVDASRAPTQRPGTTWKFNFANTGHTGNAGKTKGLVAFKGVLYAFTHDPTYATSGSSSYVIVVLRHPTSTSATVAKIHFAQPFMGYLYVVVEFSDAFVGHYWLQSPDAWTYEMQYNTNDLVQPTTPNGYYYQCQQIQNPPAWTPLLQYALYDVIQPTTFNGFQYAAAQEFGPNVPPARSGQTEPVWGTLASQFTLDFSTTAPPPEPSTPPTPPAQVPPGGGSGGRYGNPAHGTGVRTF